MAEHTHENYAKIAKSCGLTMYPDPGGERYVFFTGGKVAGKKSECCDEMIEELWNAVIRLRERLDETEASHDDEEAAHAETLAMLERLREVLRSLACYLSVGGYNSETVDPEEFERKIRDGIGMLTKPLESMVEKLRAEKEDLRQRNQLLRTRLDEFAPERIKPRLDILRRLDELQAENADLRALLAGEVYNRVKGA